MRKLFASAFAALLLSAGANAQDFPDRSVTIVVPFSAGGPTDTVARLIGDAMSKDLGQQVVVENVTGAGGTVGAARVASATRLREFNAKGPFETPAPRYQAASARASNRVGDAV